jgi:uncharacterized protein
VLNRADPEEDESDVCRSAAPGRLRRDATVAGNPERTLSLTLCFGAKHLVSSWQSRTFFLAFAIPARPIIRGTATVLHRVAMRIFRYVFLAGLMFGHASAHATSFDCAKGHSIAEWLICHNPDLSKLDDALGKFYWKARRAASDRRAFLRDSDSKWTWREINCTDEACLTRWYSTRIDELQGLLADTPPNDAPAHPRHTARESIAQTAPGTNAMSSQCTAADLGMVWHEPCATVLRQNTGWQYHAHDGDWFCGLAMVEQSPVSPDASH